MPEAVKSTKTPRKPTAKKKAQLKETNPVPPPAHEVAALAYQYWVERGRQHDDPVQDWIRAEQKLQLVK
jgi:Protein of unknown function (DUF2934)